MAGVGLFLQLVGVGLILTGAYRQARSMGAVDRWRRHAQLSIEAAWLVTVDWWNVHIRRKRSATVYTEALEISASVNAAGTVTANITWDTLSLEEKVDRLRLDIAGVDQALHAARDHLSGRVDNVELEVASHVGKVDARFSEVEQRDETLLAWEIPGGALTLLGTVLAIFGT